MDEKQPGFLVLATGQVTILAASQSMIRSGQLAVQGPSMHDMLESELVNVAVCRWHPCACICNISFIVNYSRPHKLMPLSSNHSCANGYATMV